MAVGHTQVNISILETVLYCILRFRISDIRFSILTN